MQKRPLGATGFDVTVLGLGGVFVSNIGADRQAGKQTIKRALELGINYIDTARSYADSEDVIGEALQEAAPSSLPIVATKIGGWPEPFQPKDTAALRKSVAESLKLLRLPAVQGMFVHEPDRPALFDWWDDDEAVVGPVLELLAELKANGTIAFNGLAGTTAYEVARRAASGKFDTVLTAFNYSLLWREAEHALLPVAKEHGMGVVVGAPLQQGALAERYDNELATATWISPPRKRQYEELYRLLDDLKMPLHELALRWVISNPDISTVVVGARNIQEIERNVEAAEKGGLARDVLAEVDRISAIVPFRPFEEPGGAFGLPFRAEYRGPGALAGTSSVGGIKKGENA
ncbi:MAG: aldo/keto reductase [Bifidobacteriaceae bacterium]|jgi:aryl-alcohol dehydrogenase-like predicted oxidoreductase|nr:aldo/keto reductase [Bifidobacteriaceae bacterium]